MVSQWPPSPAMAGTEDGAQDIGAGCRERHGPGLHHALPWVVTRGPRRGRCTGGVGVVVGARTTAAIVPAAAVAATTVVTVVGAVAAAVAVPSVTGLIVGAQSMRSGGGILGAGGR